MDYPLFLDKRKLELKYQIPVKNIEPFFKGLEHDKIMGTRCKDCNTLYFPPQIDCPSCKTSNMEWTELNGDAILDTYTIINVKPTSFEGFPEYIVAIGQLKEGVKVLAWLNIKDRNDIKIGMKLKLKVVKREENNLTYEFFKSE